MISDSIKTRTFHILIIDDKEESISTFRKGFSLWEKKHRLSFAQTEEEARTVLFSYQPDIIFIALKFLTKTQPFITIGEDIYLPYPIIIIIQPDEKKGIIQTSAYDEFENLVRSDRMWSEIPHLCNRCIREWKLIQIKNARECELENVRKEVSNRDEELQKKIEELRDSNSRLVQSELQFRHLFTENVAGYALHEIICDSQGIPIDYRFLEINPAFERITGILSKEISGKTVKEVLPGIESFWIDTYGKVALTGESIHFENYTAELDQYFEVTAYSPEPGKFVTVVLDVTDRKRSEKILHEREERLRLTLDATEDGIWDWNIPTGTAVFSPRWFTMLGYGPDEMPSSYATWRSLVHPDDLSIAEKKIQDHISRKDDGYAVEMRMRTGTGDYKWVLARGKVVERDKDERPVRMVGTHTDINDRKRIEDELTKKHSELVATYEQLTANEEELKLNLDELSKNEQQLRISEERLRMAQEIGHCGSWGYNIQTGQIWGSAEGFRIYGFPAVEGEIDIEKIEACIPERERVHQALEDLITKNIEYNLEFGINPADGSAPRIIQSRARIERDDHGHPLTVTGVILDITELKKKEEVLRETNAYLENLIHYSNVPIVVWNPSFQITRLNRACELLIGLADDAVRGQQLEILFPPYQKTQSMLFIKTALEGVRWEGLEIDIQHVSGLIRTVSWNSSTIYATDGVTPIAVIAQQGQDVTDRKRLEKEKESAMVQIQQNIAQLAILNDGIRNPLMIISLNADAIGETDHTRQIIDQVDKIDEMVRQLDIRWVESEKIFRFLQKHYQISVPGSSLSNSDAILENFHKNADIFNPTRIQEVQAELFTILDSLDALVYVADMNTHELLFMNKIGRISFGDIIGKRCYETLQKNQHTICPFCTNHLLIDKSGPTGVYQWEFFNQDTKRWYDCRDRAIRWVDGRIVRLEIATDITERKQALEELRRSEEMLRQITETISIGYYVFDRESNRFIYASPAYETIWKRSLSELYIDTYSFLEAIHPEDREFVQEAIRKELEEEEYLEIEYRIILPDGEIRWIHSHDFPVRNDEGVSNRIAGFAEDITSRKKSEEDLLLQVQIVQNMAEGVVMISVTDGTIVYANPRFETMFGYGPGELYGLPVSSLNAPDDRPPDTIAHEIMESLTRTGIWSGEIQNIRKDGTTFWCYAHVSTCIHHQYGEVWISVHEDISLRKEIELVLKENEEKYRTLTEQVHDGIYIYQGNSFVFVNARVSEITGYTKEELYAMNLWEIVHPDDKDRVQQIARKRYKGNAAPQTYETRIITRSGTIKTLELAVSDITYKGEYAALGAARDITSQKEVEVSLREATERYLKLVQNIPDYILVHRDWIILFVNNAAARSFGYTTDELVGSNIMKYLTKESQKRVSELMPMRMTGETFPSYEITILTKEGIPKVTEVHGVLIQFEGGPASLNVLTDVTEERRAMRELQENEEKFRSIFDMMNDGIHIHEILPDGSPGRFIDLNRVACEMVQYSREEMLMHSPIEYSTGYHSLPLHEIIGELSRAGHAIFETEHIRKDGSILPVEINAHRVRLQGKEVIVSVVRDITVRKQVEDALRESETKYRQLVENANEAIIVAQNGMMKLVNPRMADLTGFSESELLSHIFTDFIHPEDRTVVLETHYKRLAGENPPSHYTFRLIRKDGTITWVEISSVLIQWENSPATLNFLINITDRKQAEEAVRESNKKLRLLTGLTRHDIFNQVSAAQTFTDLAMKSSDTSEVHEYLSHSQEAHDRIESIIGFTREYEDFGGVSSGWKNLREIIETANKEITFGAVEKENLIPDGLEVYADPIVRKVFTTLMENAIRHGGTITRIRIHCYEERERA